MISRRPGFFIIPLLVLFFLLAFILTDTFPSKGWGAKKVNVPKRSTLPQVIDLLTEEGVLRHPRVFQLLVVGTMTGQRLKYGEYSFPTPPSTLDVWRKLVNGDVTRYYVTIPEGSTIFDIARSLSALDLADENAFLEAATSPDILRRVGISGPSAEGFLFPDTYLLIKYMSVEDILDVMVRQFRRKFTPDMEERARKAGFTVPEIVTIASIIEKETGLASEKPIISAVIRRRLILGMPLQMDPTVIYGLKRFGMPLTRADLRTPNPYNSYLNRGLPPGPIANPGHSALEAALAPADTDYLYFVSRRDGSHQFSRTLSEHNKAVATYRDSTAVAATAGDSDAVAATVEE
jgi:UPF0755 protein